MYKPTQYCTNTTFFELLCSMGRIVTQKKYIYTTHLQDISNAKNTIPIKHMHTLKKDWLF